MNDCTFTIEKHIATLSGSGSEGRGVTKQVNLISWNGKPPTIDVRAWSGRGKPYKGITLDSDEVKALKEALKTLE